MTRSYFRTIGHLRTFFAIAISIALSLLMSGTSSAAPARAAVANGKAGSTALSPEALGAKANASHPVDSTHPIAM